MPNDSDKGKGAARRTVRSRVKLDEIAASSRPTSAVDRAAEGAADGVVSRAMREAEGDTGLRAIREAMGGGTIGPLAELERISGLSSPITEAMKPLLDDYAQTRKQFSDALGMIPEGLDTDRYGALGDLDPSSMRFEIPEPSLHAFEPIANPIHETNEHLEALTIKIERLAEHHEKQVDLVDRLFLVVVEAATTADTASRANLRTARLTLCVSALAVVAAIVIPLVLR